MALVACPVSYLTFVEILIPTTFSTELATSLDGDEEPCTSSGSHPPGPAGAIKGRLRRAPASLPSMAPNGAEGPWHPVASTLRRWAAWDEILKERGSRHSRAPHHSIHPSRPAFRLL